MLPKWNDLSEEEVILIESAARDGIRDKNKFLRAWSYQALFEASRILPDLKEELVFICERALPDESAPGPPS